VTGHVARPADVTVWACVKNKIHFEVFGVGDCKHTVNGNASRGRHLFSRWYARQAWMASH